MGCRGVESWGEISEGTRTHMESPVSVWEVVQGLLTNMLLEVSSHPQVPERGGT